MSYWCEINFKKMEEKDIIPFLRSLKKRLVFDFSEIDFMGQGFADEIFRVFQNRHPDIVLTVNNANEEVAGMIQHVKSNGNH